MAGGGDLLRPFSSRVKLVIFYNEKTKSYEISEKDRQIMQDYISFEDFYKTTHEIETSVKLRPFDKRTPCLNTLGLVLMSFIVILIYLYVCFIILQLALFNPIMMGVMYVYFKKVFGFLTAIRFRYDYNYRNKDFKKFVEAENERFYRKEKNIELVGGEQGKWLELQLPDDIEDREFKDNIYNSLDNTKPQRDT